MAPEGGYLIPVVVAGGADDATRSWLLGMRFPLGGGINGLAAIEGVPVWTSDYLADPRIPHEPDDQSVARRMGLVGMAAAPLRAPSGDVIGTLAISTSTPRTFEPDDLDLLQGLADQAAIALTNSRLLARVTRRRPDSAASSRRRPTSCGARMPMACSPSWPIRPRRCSAGRSSGSSVSTSAS